MKKKTIKAVEMVRRIRDAHYEQLHDKSPEECIAFYRAKARSFKAENITRLQEQSENNELQAA